MRHGVVDIGSNTATLAVFDLHGGVLDRVAQMGEPLRLMRRLGPDGMLPATAIERTAQALRSYRRRAEELGATIEAVATSAVRDARNQDRFLAAIDETGVPCRTIAGDEEAVYAARSAIGTLPFSDGTVIDLGGGSLQLCRVRNRRIGACVSLPLGGLRLADAFLTTDPPDAGDLTRLRRHADALLRTVPWLRDEPELIAIGGSVRALAKVDRRQRRWPVLYDHGYPLDEDAILTAYESLSRMDARARALVPGLAPHRVDTIVPVAVVLLSLLRATRIDRLRVSGCGVREGIALTRYGKVPSVRAMRAASLHRRLPALSEKVVRDVAGTSGDEAALQLGRALHAARLDPTPLLEAPVHGFTHEELVHAAGAAGFRGP